MSAHSAPPVTRRNFKSHTTHPKNFSPLENAPLRTEYAKEDESYNFSPLLTMGLIK